VTVGEGEAVGALEDAVLDDVGVLEDVVELNDVVDLPVESEEEPPQPASSTRAPVRAQTLAERVIDMSAELNRFPGSYLVEPLDRDGISCSHRRPR
jgi:hypothetical protein